MGDVVLEQCLYIAYRNVCVGLQATSASNQL